MELADRDKNGSDRMETKVGDGGGGRSWEV